ncbi:MAG: DNA repair protein RadC [Clostridiales bacterium]|jgi:DNA repair protein RadC|nr:DNA repair protein RadC [Clostridiales bacterium]
MTEKKKHSANGGVHKSANEGANGDANECVSEGVNEGAQKPAGALHRGHRQRTKDRFLKEGMNSFDSHQILELLLYYSVPYKDTNPLAHNLIERFGSLSGVFEADYAELAGIENLGAHSAFLLKMIPELARRYLGDRWKDRPSLNNTVKAGEYAVTLFIGRNNEAFFLICLDAQNRVIMPALICEGTINEAMVYPRTIIENAIRYKANRVIFAHNHPGGSIKPSKADIDVTGKLAAALENIAVKVVDHIIVAGQQYVSLAEQKLM